MMKFTLLLLLSVLTLAVCKGQKCSRDEDCPENGCCVSRACLNQLLANQVCSQSGSAKRCACAEGLTCQITRELRLLNLMLDYKIGQCRKP
ncbi:uncharacterized protein LOC116602999 [Nematostella vectensis]|uniref:uncharacterized protein LOC116602999 n=1 Tax=Nematostella vectensis TaxID=45351 RepID=UPI00138FAFC3|nr:uncharacterized protein LOC116602999 [Nematostella vectensis]